MPLDRGKLIPVYPLKKCREWLRRRPPAHAVGAV